MRLTLQREPSAAGATIGALLVDGRHECWTLEDVVRQPGVKVPGATAIPAGIYRVVVTHSPRFGRLLPLLDAVPGYAGIRIHPGNTAADTDGCILVGQTRAEATIGSSRLAFDALFPRLAAACDAGEVWIEIIDPPS